MTDRSMEALRQADPEITNPAEVDYEALRDRIVASPVVSCSESRRWKPSGVSSRALSAVGVGALAAALLFGAFGPIGRPSTESAYAAMAQAVAKTIELGTSGTVVTSLQATRADGKREEPLPDVEVSDQVSAADFGSTFKWNGDDFELSGPRDLRLVGGELYALTDDQWWHLGAFGSAPSAGGVGSGMDEWLRGSKRAYAPESIADLVKRLDGLVQEDGNNGSTTYTGTTTVQAVRECFSKGAEADGNDVVGMMLPKSIAPDTQIRVQLTVGADNILSAWTGSYSARGADFVFAPVGTNGSEGYQYPDVVYNFVFTADYKDIGSTPAIEQPSIAK